MSDEEKTGSGDAKVWVSSQVPERVIEFLREMEAAPDKVDLIELGIFVSQNFVGEAETDAWLRYIASIRTKPHLDYRDMGPDGKIHRYRIDRTFKNPAVRDVFYKTLFNELRKKTLKMDAISQLGYMIGSWRKKDDSQVKYRRPSSWQL